tara:strand:+ start:560 stop:979 length:420 start_codon:yes stop_codon:yes gene_type:complete
MAATIYTGQINPGSTFTHTNSSGGNERVVINYIYAGNESGAASYPITVKFGTTGTNGTTGGDNETYFQIGKYTSFGKSVAWATSSNSYGGGQNAYTSSGSSTEGPTEIYLANGHHFKIETNNNLQNQAQARYQVLVIPE